MSNWGLKVIKKGAQADSQDVRDIIMSSKYSMLKYHSEHFVSSTLSPGDTGSYVDIPHSLGYVPAFMAYYKDLNGNFRYIPGLPDGIGYDSYAYAYATNGIIRVGVNIASGAYNQFTTTASDLYSTLLSSNTWCIFGDVGGTGDTNGAVRFTGVTVPQGSTISSASVDLWVWDRGSGTGNLKVNHYGIDEDNTADFTSNPMGRSTTDAYGTLERTKPDLNTFMNITMKDQVQEIVNRGGWSSGNAMGFIIRDNGSADNVYVGDNTYDTKLTITYGSATTIYYKVIIFKDRIF